MSITPWTSPVPHQPSGNHAVKSRLDLMLYNIFLCVHHPGGTDYGHYIADRSGTFSTGASGMETRSGLVVCGPRSLARNDKRSAALLPFGSSGGMSVSVSRKMLARGHRRSGGDDRTGHNGPETHRCGGSGRFTLATVLGKA